MSLRCFEGQIAMINRESPGCEPNVGRLVEVTGPLKFSPYYQAYTWLIRPLRPQDPYWIERKTGIVAEHITWADRIEHPDLWLTPIAERSAGVCLRCGTWSESTFRLLRY